MDAPSAQGVCGFTGTKNVFELSDVSIETSNDYASIQLVALDERSISKSSKILVQVGTIYQPTDWKESATDFDLNGTKVSGFQIENTGKMPWKCANTQVSFKLKNTGINQATLLDAAGYPQSTIQINQVGSEIQITLPENAMYVILENTTHSGNFDLNEKRMKVFPNPSDGNFRVEIQNFKTANYSFELLGLQGEQVLELKNIQYSTFKINTTNLSNGVFLAVLKNEQGIVETKKVVIHNN